MTRPASALLRCKGNSGFTLLELLISIAVIGVIAGIVAAALRLGFRSVESGEQRMSSVERTRASLSLIEYQILSEIPLVEARTRQPIFKGEPSLLQFPSNYSIWGGPKGYVAVTYTIETDGNGKKSLAVSEAFIGQSGGGGDTRLFEDYDNIAFEYFYKESTEEKGRWVEQWKDSTNIPEKVRLRLASGGTETVLVIPLRARGSLAKGTAATSVTLSGQLLGK